MIRSFRDLKVYQLAYRLGLEVYKESKRFPPEERFGLTSQIGNSSRSIPALIAEAWPRRKYEKAFANKLSEADGEVSETQVWLDFARDHGFIVEERCKSLLTGYEQVGKMLGSMRAKAHLFAQ